MATNETTKIYDFGKIDFNGTGRRINRVTVEVSLKETAKGPVFTASGDIWNAHNTDIISGGQILDRIPAGELQKNITLFKKIRSLWKAYHANGMHAGTPAQENLVKGMEYRQACEVLKAHNLYNDNGYIYGTGWLYQPIPGDDLAKIYALVRG